MIALRSSHSKQSFLQDRVLTVPQRQPETKTAFAVGNAEQSIFSPPIGAAAGVIVRKIVPTVAPFGVILADRSPLPLREVWAPPFPILFAATVFRQALLFGQDGYGW